MGDPITREPRFAYRVKRLYMLQSRRIDDALKAHGLARSQWQVLKRVRSAGEIAQRDLQQHMEVESATLTGLVDVLVAKGWLERFESPADKRVRILRFTAAGEERWRDIPDPIDEVQARMFDGIAESDRALAADVIDRMIRNLEDRPKD
jgi:DNA-binding MarR family transcriptional regulator